MGNIDIYARPVNFNFQGYKLVPSYCGGIISLIVECLLIAYLVFLLIDMTDRESPLVSNGIKTHTFPDDATINAAPTSFSENKSKKDYNLFSAFCLFSNNVCTESDFLEIIVEQKEIEDGFVKSTNLSLTDYDPGSYKVKWQKGSEPKDAGGSKLIKDSFKLSKLYGMNGAKWIEIKVRYKEGIDPETYTKIETFELWQERKRFGPSEYKDDMILSTVDQMFWDLLPTNTKVATYQLVRQTLKVNDYYLPRFLIPKSKRYILTATGMEDQTKGYDGKNLMVFKFFLGREEMEIERNFQDVFTILAMIGGLAGTVITILIILVFVIRDFRMNERAMKDCYYILHPGKRRLLFEEYIRKLYLMIEKKGVDNPKGLQTELANLDNDENAGGLFYDYSMDVEGKDSKKDTPLTRFFNLRRLKDILTFDENGKIIPPITVEKKLKYFIAKTIFEASYLKSEPDYSINTCEMLSYFCFTCCCCSKKKQLYKFKSLTKKNLLKKMGESPEEDEKHFKRNQSEAAPLNQTAVTNKSGLNPKPRRIPQEFSVIERKYALYKGGRDRVETDFDIIEVMKGINDFDMFTKIILSKKQREIFNLCDKKVFSDTFPKETEDMDSEEMEYHDLIALNKTLYKLTRKGELKSFQVKLIELLGITRQEIEEFLKLIVELNGEEISFLDDYKPKEEEENPVEDNENENIPQNEINQELVQEEQVEREAPPAEEVQPNYEDDDDLK
ncbi:MAG: hypothetical protein MJ252_04440 [archaeon]|nr:hypothetical protein [archaeon]